ncbi:hypothetical protein E4O93_08960 [Diaphorobacter sp. DS2]|nr:hypothetical protein E4O93_08960 [Diaphorobacter sp. DS2]
MVGASTYHDLSDGDVVEVIGGALSSKNEKVKRIYDERIQAVPKPQLIRATDEEVAEAKRQAAEKAVADKWADIGRKPNEFKVGDAVQYKKAFTTVSYVGPKYIRIRQSSNVEHNIAVNPANLTLVFPVESKFGGDSE